MEYVVSVFLCLVLFYGVSLLKNSSLYILKSPMEKKKIRQADVPMASELS